VRIKIKQSSKADLSIKNSQARINIWHGSVSSGKTIASIVRWLIFCHEYSGGSALLMTGKTLDSLRRNVLEIMDDIPYVRYSIASRTAHIFGKKIHLVGANDDRSEGKIRGLTVGGIYGDEVTLWPENFFRMALSRMRVENAKMFLTTNPDSPYHWLKTDFIDNKKVNCAQFHFNIWDNQDNLPDGYIENLEQEYTGLWHKRFILGHWVQAEGAIYDCWHDGVIKRADFTPTRYYIGLDYGTQNPTVFLLIGTDGRSYHVLKEYYHDGRAKGQKTNSQYLTDLVGFTSGYPITAVIADPSASLKTDLRTRFKVIDANNAVLDGIATVSKMIQQGRLTFEPDKTEKTCQEMQGYVWAPNSLKTGKDTPLKIADHAPDALRYVLHTVANRWDGGRLEILTK